jgi:hypothetical protein
MKFIDRMGKFKKGRDSAAMIAGGAFLDPIPAARTLSSVRLQGVLSRLRQLAQDDEVVQALAPDRSDQPLDKAILPRREIGPVG